MTVYVLPPRVQPIGKAINVTSRVRSVFSPFTLGPVDLYHGHKSMNVENAWQFSKVYPQHVGENGRLKLHAYMEWARKGWSDDWAHRYPMGKGAKPLFSYWDGDRFGYVEARRKIYIPLYTQAVERYAYRELEELAALAETEDITLVDFDAYNHHDLGMSIGDVFRDPNRKAGHGFVLALLIEYLRSNK